MNRADFSFETQAGIEIHLFSEPDLWCCQFPRVVKWLDNRTKVYLTGGVYGWFFTIFKYGSIKSYPFNGPFAIRLF
jgi:hypothetical protein